MTATQASLVDFDSVDAGRFSFADQAERLADRSTLTYSEAEAYVACEYTEHNYGPRRLAQKTNRSPGTVGNLLARARQKLDEDGGSDG